MYSLSQIMRASWVRHCAGYWDGSRTRKQSSGHVLCWRQGRLQLHGKANCAVTRGPALRGSHTRFDAVLSLSRNSQFYSWTSILCVKCIGTVEDACERSVSVVIPLPPCWETAFVMPPEHWILMGPSCSRLFGVKDVTVLHHHSGRIPGVLHGHIFCSNQNLLQTQKAMMF